MVMTRTATLDEVEAALERRRDWFVDERAELGRDLVHIAERNPHTGKVRNSTRRRAYTNVVLCGAWPDDTIDADDRPRGLHRTFNLNFVTCPACRDMVRDNPSRCVVRSGPEDINTRVIFEVTPLVPELADPDPELTDDDL
jgi:hypothetical protein